MRPNTVPWRMVAVYCVLACALLWVPFLGATLAARGGHEPGMWSSILGIMGPYSPLIAAVLTRTLCAREGFRDAHLGILRTRWYFWCLALVLPCFWNGVQDALQIFRGYATMDWSKMGGGLYRIPINLFGGVFIFIGEEFGWRSYLVEKLRPLRRWNALLLSGTIWALWHAPLLLIPSEIYTRHPDVPGVCLSLLVFVLMGFIFGWLYFESNSVWPCALMHSSNNLIALKLFREAWTVTAEPTLLQNASLAFGPIFFVWLVLFWRHGFTRETGGRANHSTGQAREDGAI